MKNRSFNRTLAALLEPLGFVPTKGRRQWLREQDGFLDEIDIQLSRGLDEVTVNYGMRHQVARLAVEAVAGRGRSGGGWVVEGRVGEATAGKGRWWRRSDPQAGPEAAELVEREVLPLFARMHTVEPYIEVLAAVHGRERWVLVSPRLELAVLLHSRGERERAWDLLTSPPSKLRDGELERVIAVRDLLARRDAQLTL